MVPSRSQVEPVSVNPDLELTHCCCVLVNTKEGRNHLFNKYISSMVLKGKVARFHFSSGIYISIHIATCCNYRVP